MKIQNVTHKEYSLEPGMVIISHTDPKGKITYVNDDFLKASGYTREEVMGKPHNILRHPDMPKEAFEDLWNTVQGNQPWQGVVKNRCKNGDHYWVVATVTPLKNNEGYMSVRYPCDYELKKEAENLYRDMKMNSDKYKLFKGGVYRSGLRFFLAKLKIKFSSMSISTKLLVPIFLFALILGTNLFFESKKLENEVLIEAGKANAENSIMTARNARAFYSQEIIPKAMQNGLGITHDFKNDPHGIPLPASLMRSLGEMSQGGNAGELRLYSKNPFSFNRNTNLDTFEEEAISFLEKNPSDAFYRLEEKNGRQVFRLARADVMINDSCIACHNNHPDSTRTNWKIGDVRGAISVSIPVDNISSNLNTIFTRAIIVNSIIGLFAIIILLWVASTQVKRIRSLKETLGKIAGGDLDVEVPNSTCTDEIGDLSGNTLKLRNQLAEMVSETKSSSRQFEIVVSQVVEKSNMMVDGAHRQSDSANMISAAAEELSASITQLAEFGNLIHNISLEAGETAREGGDKVIEASQISSQVASVVQDAADELKTLQEATDEINKIVSTITGIAEQTNLLALNAAIEAARAGEQGRGFAVVADEVRNLATKTATSTGEIKGLVERIMTQTGKAVERIEHSVEKVQEGVQASSEAGKSVFGIKEKTSKVMEAADQIRMTLQDQQAASHEVAEKINQVAEDANTSSAQAEEATRTISKIIPMLDRLQNMASKFKLLGQ